MSNGFTVVAGYRYRGAGLAPEYFLGSGIRSGAPAALRPYRAAVVPEIDHQSLSCRPQSRPSPKTRRSRSPGSTPSWARKWLLQIGTAAVGVGVVFQDREL